MEMSCCTFSVQSSGTGLWREAEHRLSSVTAHSMPARHGGRLELHWKGIIAVYFYDYSEAFVINN